MGGGEVNMCTSIGGVIAGFVASHVIDIATLFGGTLVSTCISVKIEKSNGEPK